MSDEINDKNDDGTNVADAVSPSGEIEVLDIKRATPLPAGTAAKAAETAVAVV